MKLLWTGTDALFFSSWPKHKRYYILALKVFAYIADIFVQEHYVVSEHLKPELKGLRKPIKVHEDPPLYMNKVVKIKHKQINILYLYKAGEFWEWIYGYDIIEKLEDAFPECTFIKADGSKDMNYVYPFIDLYIRPNRHDGKPRMIMECEINDIPYLATKENPTFEYFHENIKQWLKEFTR